MITYTGLEQIIQAHISKGEYSEAFGKSFEFAEKYGVKIELYKVRDLFPYLNINIETVSQSENTDNLLVIGLQYLSGLGKEKDPAKAYPYIKLAAEKYNNVNALILLAHAYYVAYAKEKKDDFTKKALEYLEKAINLGNKQALFLIGMIYQNTKNGALQDDAKALEYYQRAAKLEPTLSDEQFKLLKDERVDYAAIYDSTSVILTPIAKRKQAGPTQETGQAYDAPVSQEIKRQKI